MASEFINKRRYEELEELEDLSQVYEEKSFKHKQRLNLLERINEEELNSDEKKELERQKDEVYEKELLAKVKGAFFWFVSGEKLDWRNDPRVLDEQIQALRVLSERADRFKRFLEQFVVEEDEQVLKREEVEISEETLSNQNQENVSELKQN